MEEWVGVVDVITLRRVKWCLAMLLTVISFAYAGWVVFVTYAGILELFTWPIIFARAGGMGTAIITGLMYLTMARTFMKQFYKFLGVNNKLLMVLDGHKDLHIFLGKCLGVTAAVHVLAHLLSTVPAVHYVAKHKLNAILACANREEKLKGIPNFAWLQWPACPLGAETEGMGWSVLWRSTPGITGLLLIALLVLLGWTGRARARSADFDRFWYAHNVVLVAWPLTMFAHGSNQWIGVGFPLVAFTATLPVCLYLADRVGRLLRFYAFGGKAVQIAEAVIRPGRGGGPSGALTHLAITRPTGLWAFTPGMYAFVCMPEYAPMQWHPFTICSGRNDEHVEFIIAGVGDWTQELAARCLQAQDGSVQLPRIALDGPYAAPAQSALSCPILVAVGAGVGITPFLSLMSSLISLIEDSSESEELRMKEAHFFWMTRSMDEFLFGRKHLTRIAQCHRLRQKIHLHLHMTAREPEGDAAAFLFRQAVKRQSRLDQAAFREEFDAHRVLMAPQLPWCWVNRSELDVMWLSDLTTASGDARDAALERLQPAPGSPRGPAAAPAQHASTAAGPGQRHARGERRPAPPAPPLTSALQGHTDPAPRGRAPGQASGAEGEAPLVPIAFGRPDFETELRAIGRHWNCQALNAEARGNAEKASPSAQKFVVTYERFG
ncbi:unnamed protein product [Prorocentrum cordatum]|uniref:FAD-binding FR-type domain-containing protein n=1 Tax=Prorocentrum cordatum TaxID=2364126 RepID=A0ABN9PMY1_9DINO|nr:unnamed protein product [Polarella glacialis]